MTDEDQNPGRKWGSLENDDQGDRHFDHYRYTPFTTDQEFFRDTNIYETEVARSTQDTTPETDSPDAPRGEHLTDERIQDQIQQLLARLDQIDASAIRVEVSDGLVTLSGRVASQDEKETAGRVAGNAFGVLQVSNQLSVGPQAAPDR